MFFYLLAKQVNVRKHTEQIASVTMIKYIILLLVVKTIEYKYFDLGFFNLYVGLFVLADVLFSLYHYYDLSTKGLSGIYWDDEPCVEYSEIHEILRDNRHKCTTMKYKRASENSCPNSCHNSCPTDLKQFDLLNITSKNESVEHKEHLSEQHNEQLKENKLENID
jgi:hypothetical protein